MVRKPESRKPDKEEIVRMRQRLEELEQTLSAIQNGEVDALVISGENDDQVYTLKSAERPYRIMIEQMNEGALMLSTEGIILYCNESFARMVRRPLEKVVATPVFDYIEPSGRDQFRRLLKHSGRGKVSILTEDATLVPAYAAVSILLEEQTVNHCLVMTDLTVHNQNDQIIASEKFAYSLLEQAADAILVCDTSGAVIRASDKAFSLVRGNPLGQPFDRVFDRIYTVSGIGSHNEAEEVPVTFAMIRDSEIPSGIEAVAVVNDKMSRNVLLNFSRILEGNIVLGYSISFSDITERKQMEEALQKYTRDIESANKEIEAFSYSVSHDLRAPLRALDGFSQMVINDYGDKLDETGKDYLNRVRKASQYMSELIDDMLKLSRITRADMYRDKVDLSGIVRSIADELKAGQAERKVDFKIAPDIMVKGDKQLLTIALRNLLENAWKFTGKCPRALIEFGVTQQNGENVYFLQDNGVGFNTAYSNKLFQPFQRLHSEKEYGGTGIGLAIVQRVIRRHAGKIWAESEKGKGATFYFTLG